ncbi:lactate utilization protein [Desulfosarcina sp. OttesenSCG-928-A07]|nr:lactate utilization protein [Desulfosarcina sp. OttesenSCG-928-G17]MDL2329650.1 lactate utilization protein [Desulfosarcina sp. OttesenSCG-928-A07]
MDNAAYESWVWEKTANRCVGNLLHHDFDAHYHPDAESAVSAILQMAAPFSSFGFGGSSTTRSLGIVDALMSQGKIIHDHWQLGLNASADLSIRLDQGRCDCFICSANAISVTGEIVNVDGVGNRTNAMTFGCPKVILVAGMNKVTPDLESALRRVPQIAAPMRAKSLDLKTPCAETGVCSDCSSPQRICRVTTILHRRPMMTDISIFLIGGSLGF